jgi:hypothetical protein
MKKGLIDFICDDLGSCQHHSSVFIGVANAPSARKLPVRLWPLLCRQQCAPF